MNVQIATEQPPTTAKIILYTSHGQIDLELWTKQAPLASKNFIQHSLEGYYSNCIFHRLIPGFMIQGGDPTGTGMGGDSVFGGPFKDEFHQRLKFTRRGILAMANAGKNTNKSQFFITFGPCEHLNKRHTIFGKVVGDTIYNLMAMQSLDTGQQDRPLDPPVIRKIKVVQNPFTDVKVKSSQKAERTDDIVNKQQKLEKSEEQFEKENKNKKQQLKKLKNKKKLTFDNDEQDQEDPAPKIVSSHDVLYKKDASLSNKLSLTKEEIERKRKEKEIQESKANFLKNTLSLNESYDPNLNEYEDRDINKLVSNQMQKKRAQFERNSTDQGHNQNKDEILNYVRRYNPTTNKYDIVFHDQLDRQRIEKEKQEQLQRKAKQQQEISDQKLRQVRQMQINEYNLLKAEELNFKKAKQGSMKERRKQIIHEEKKLLSNLEKHRYEFTQKQKMNQHEGELFKKLIDFSTRLKSVQSSKKEENGQNQEKSDNSDSRTKPNKMSWMNHKLKFHIDSMNAYSLEEKALRVGKGNLQDEDDGGLKMEIEYNNDEDEQDENNIEKVLKNI